MQPVQPAAATTPATASSPAAVRVWRATSSTAVTVLDGLSPACAPFAAWWDTEAGRRRKLRTPEHQAVLADARQVRALAGVAVAQARSQCKTAREASANPLAARRRAARLAAKTAKGRRRAARAEVRAARVAYPAALYQRALQAHAAHVVPTSGVSAASWLSSQDWTTVWPASLSAGLLGLHAGALYLGRRHAAVAPAAPEESVSVEERQLLDRLHPEYWTAHAAGRGLAGTLTTPPTLGPGGIRCEVRLDGTWTVKALAAKADSIRALLGARTALRLRITGGARGGWAVLTLATRHATDGVSAAWTSARIPADPTAMSVGVDTETGEEVLVPFDERMLISGASGAGKSWSTRPLMATAHLRGDLVFLDGKGEEATLWDGVCRVAVTAAEINLVIDEVHAEMTRRAAVLKRRTLSRWDGPQLTVLIDEGQVVLAQVRRDKGRLQRLVELSSLGRSRGVVLWWATQCPVTDGAAPGVDEMIAPNLLTRFSLRVASST
ncbi:type IV secretory system conjugative DNA transfer family protein, partial [Candidatus Frankia alpina]|uniref:type IV secretory system conjugative DNA transfer family protein n=1 Tax=Candidatus Frankia alpina TaxID=2699483 RepID=UPI00138768C6